VKGVVESLFDLHEKIWKLCRKDNLGQVGRKVIKKKR
jgi:uncharacterized membrane protein